MIAGWRRRTSDWLGNHILSANANEDLDLSTVNSAATCMRA
jgi:hypothetical protein